MKFILVGLLVLLAGFPLGGGAQGPVRRQHSPEAKEGKGDEASSMPRRGRWEVARPRRQAPSVPRELREKLESLGYLSGSEAAPPMTNVLRYDPAKAWNGLNLYVSTHGCEAFIVDMDGKVLHTWSYSYERLYGSAAETMIAPHRWRWHRPYLYPNGDILIILAMGMIKLDKDSNLIWLYPKRAHHDMFVTEAGNIYVLTKEANILPRFHSENTVVEDFINILDKNGKELRQISILECLENGKQEEVLAEVRALLAQGEADVLHTNSLEILDGSMADRIPQFKRGNILTSFLTNSVVAVVDPEQEKVVWTMRGKFREQHDPTILENGNMLIFDNKGPRRGSAIREIDPLSGREVWVYQDTGEDPFYSNIGGKARRLPNGNTLIIETTAGRAFEITRGKEIVWEFLNPHRAGPKDEYIAMFSDVIRLSPDFPLDWL